MYIAYSEVNLLVLKTYPYDKRDFCVVLLLTGFFLLTCISHHNILCIFLFKDYALESIVSFQTRVASFSIWYSFNFISIFI